jgi:hypothetical protein
MRGKNSFLLCCIHFPLLDAFVDFFALSWYSEVLRIQTSRTWCHPFWEGPPINHDAKIKQDKICVEPDCSVQIMLRHNVISV